MNKDKLCPELRFPEFTDDWEQRKVSDVFKITRGYVLAATETSPSTSDDNIYPVYSSQTKNEGLMGYYRNYLYEDAITWTTDGANAGTVKFRKGKFYCTNVCGVLLSNEGIANKAVAEALNAVAWKYVSHVGNPKLMNNVMAEIDIIIPKTVEEQQKISEYLDNLDHLITLHQRKRELLEKSKKAMMQKIFSQEVRFKKPDGSDFPEWEEKKLGEVLLIQRGGSPRPIDKYITSDENGINWIKIGDAPVQGNRITAVKEKILPEGKVHSREVRKGDLILSNSMSFGRPYILEVDGCIHDGWLLLRDEDNIFDLSYLCETLGSPNVFAQYKKLAAGGVVNNLNKEIVSGVQIPIPSKDEQKLIADFFTSFDEAITAAKQELESWKLLKKGLLQQMFV